MINQFTIESHKQFDLMAICNVIRKDWKKIRRQTSTQTRGVIKKCLQTSKAGSIQSDDGNDDYFSLKDVDGDKGTLQESDRVTFVIEEGFGKKKGKISLVAVRVRKT